MSKQITFHSRTASPKNISSLHIRHIGLRSKSTTSFVVTRDKMEAYHKNIDLQTAGRIKSAIKINRNQNVPSFSKTQIKGKLFLGKIIKPNLIMSHEHRNNPWGELKPVNEEVICQKGLMQIINMGLVPKTANFTELLNYKYEIEKETNALAQNQDEGEDMFATNPQIKTEAVQKVEEPPKSVQVEEKEARVKKIRKKVKKAESNLIKNEVMWQQIFKRKPILQIANQNVAKDDEYKQCLKMMMQEGNEVAFKEYIRSMQAFAKKYQLRKFQFHILIDETKKTSDSCLYDQILNPKALGIHWAMRGNKQIRGQCAAKMIMTRFKYKKARKELEKIENIKRYFKIKKFYEEMTVKRTDFLKYKLGIYAENQRRLVEEASENKFNHFRVQIHIPSLSDSSYQSQQSFYKLEHRNNIQLTRLFSTNPEYIILIINQEIDITPWLKILSRIPGYHPLIQILPCTLAGSKVKCYDEIYYGLNRNKISSIKSICGKKNDSGLIVSSFDNTVIKICEITNVKLLGGNFYKPHLDQLLAEQENQQQELCEEKAVLTVEQKYFNIRQNILKNRKKHFLQKQKIKKYNGFEIVNKFFNNKMNIKKQIFMKFQCSIPETMLFESGQEENVFYTKLTKMILDFKEINRWAFKLADESRFSRGLAFLETDSLKILKEKKKKKQVVSEDIEEVSKIMKIILLDKIEIPQNSLLDRDQFLEQFITKGGYVEAVIPESSTIAIFGIISPDGKFTVLGSYTKLYTDEIINCAAFYPAEQLTAQHLTKVHKVSAQLYADAQLFGYVTYQLLIDKNKNFYFIDFVPSLEQYSSLYFMYSSFFKSAHSTFNKMKSVKDYNDKNRGKEQSAEELKSLSLVKKIVYCPFIDNNGNTFTCFGDFQDACFNKKLAMDFQQLEGIQFLYLNLRQAVPDVLSIITMASSCKKALKYCLDGLNFLIDSGERTNKFDRKVQRRKYDCLYMNDILWKMRELKKSMDNSKQ